MKNDDFTAIPASSLRQRGRTRGTGVRPNGTGGLGGTLQFELGHYRDGKVSGPAANNPGG
jgi:hypothetical protein